MKNDLRKGVIFNLQLFAVDLNVNKTTDTTATTGNDLSVEMKTYYSDYLIDIAQAKLVHDQFGQKHPIPKNGGKTIEFRKYKPLGKLTTPMQEGVTPTGQELTVEKITATVDQYGGFVGLTDVLELTAIDNNVIQATKLIGNQAGATLDTITRDVLNGGTSVIYANSDKYAVTARANLAEGENIITVRDIKKAARYLKTQNAEKINGSFVAIIHPDVAFDLTDDPDWKDVKEYCDPKDMYEGEIGKLHGVRFVETTEAKIFAGAGEGNRDVYSTLVLADNAYGVTEIEGGGLQHIIKQLGSGGTADPLNQRSTVGWKAMKVAERLVEQYMVRIESVSTFASGEN